MSNNWLQKKCIKCDNGLVFYLSQWINVPKHCDRCRLLEIYDLKSLFKDYLRKEDELKNHCMALENKLLFSEREPLRIKVKQALEISLKSSSQIIDFCLEDKDLKRLVFRLNKERKLNESSRDNKKIFPKVIGSILQGGAPGLGKRS